MKKMYLLIMAFVAVCGSLVAQTTDVTATYLTNAGFNTGCNFLATDVAANLVVANGGANLKTVPGWTVGTIGDNSAAAAFEYGYAGSLNLSGATGMIPAQGPDNATGAGQGALGISAAWSATITYYQTVTLLPGEYSIQYAAYNSGPNVADYSRVGWVPNSGTSVISTKTSFALNTWVNESLTVKVYSATTGKIQVGISTPNSGSGAVGRIFFDYVKIVRNDVVDKTELQTVLSTATTMYGNQQPVGSSTAYADLNSVISTAQGVYDNATATSPDVYEQVGLLQSKIAAVNSAIAIQARIAAWTTLPYNATSVIVNPSFETATANNQSAFAGWTNVGPLVSQNNTSFPYKAGTYYVEKWKGSGNWTGLKISQKVIDLPNGVYSLTAGALNDPNTTGGAFVFANAEKVEVFTAKDYTVIVTVTNHELEIGYEVVNGGNYVAVDNFRLTYVSDGSPYVVLSPATLFFDPNNLTRTINVTGGNLSTNLTLSAPTGITLDKSVLTPAEVAAGAVVTATFDNATAITNGAISATSGSLTQSVTVNTSADLSCFTPLYTSLTNIIPNAYMNDISAFGGWGHKSVVLGEAHCGAACVKFDAVTNGYPDGAALDVANIPWAANSTYRLHVWVKAVDGTFAFLAKNTNPDVLITVPMSGNDWVEIDTMFTTGAAPTASFFTFNNVDGASTGKVAYIDNYELYNVTSIITGTTPLKDNSFNAFVRDNKVVVRVNLTAETQAQINVYNMNGMLIASEKIAGTNEKILNTNLAGGVYLVQMQSEGKLITQKIIK